LPEWQQGFHVVLDHLRHEETINKSLIVEWLCFGLYSSWNCSDITSDAAKYKLDLMKCFKFYLTRCTRRSDKLPKIKKPLFVWKGKYLVIQKDLVEGVLYKPFREDKEKLKGLLIVLVDPQLNVKDKIISTNHAKVSVGNKFYEMIGVILEREVDRNTFYERLNNSIKSYEMVVQTKSKIGDKGVITKWRQGLNIKLKSLFHNFELNRDLIIQLIYFRVWFSCQEGRTSLDQNIKIVIRNHYVDLLKQSGSKKRLPDMPVTWESIYPKMVNDLCEIDLFKPYGRDEKKMKNLLLTLLDPEVTLNSEVTTTYHSCMSSGNKFYEMIASIMNEDTGRTIFVEKLNRLIESFEYELKTGQKGILKWHQGLMIKLKSLFNNYKVNSDLIIQLICFRVWYSGHDGHSPLDQKI